MDNQTNKLHEFSNGAYDEFETVSSVVEEILGQLGRLGRTSWIVDATVEDPLESTLFDLVREFDMKFADARGVSTGVNECIEKSGAKHDAIACVVAANSCAMCPPMMVLSKNANEPDDYVKIYATNDVDVFVRRDLARRIGARSMEIMSKKNEITTE